MSKFKVMTPKVLAVLLAIPMILAGLAKLAGTPELHQSFQMMGLPEWFGYFIGLAELLGGIGLLVSRFSALASLALIPIMLGAVYFHIAYAVPSAIPAIAFTLLATVVVYLRREEAIWLPFKN
jgi:uncharacterized membrane protein YphA (DoxX/SURF4 family)